MKTRRLAPGASILLSAAVVLALPHDTDAASAECCLRGTSSAMAALRGVGQDPDEQFFMSKPAPPNLMFFLDTSGSMQRLPIEPSAISLSARGNGCEAAVYDAILSAGSFDQKAPAGTYPPADLGVDPSKWSGDKGFEDLFHEGGYYRWNEWWEDGASDYGSAHSACSAVPTSSGNDGVSNRHTQCEWCLQNKGYYLDNKSTNQSLQVFSGKFLNFYSPKYVVARTVLKQVIWDLRQVRFGVTTFNTSNTGGNLLQEMSPACDKSLDPEDASNSDDTNSWTNQRKSIINKLNSVYPFGSNTPLAEAMFNIGQYFTSDDSVFKDWFGSGWTVNSFKNGSLNSQGRSVCWGCQVSGVVLITDGAPCADNCVPSQIRNQHVNCTGCNQMDCGCSGSCNGSCNDSDGNQLDDVTKWFAEHDLQTKNPSNGTWNVDGRQKLISYTVGFGLDHPLLKNAAEVTGGVYYTAKDKESLKSSLLAAIADINRRATAFGVSSISTLQTTSAGASAAVPRFIPDQPGQPWKGMLFRFKVDNEFVNGCVPTAPSDPVHAKDIDGDHLCQSIFFRDLDDDLVEEDASTGMFMKKGTSQLAKPIWEAGRELTYDNPTYNEPESASLRNPDTRSIWTVVDSNSDGKLDINDPVVEFTVSNASQLMPYMQISADIRNDPVCTGIANLLGVDSSDPTRINWGEQCARTIIEYYRGRKALDTDPAERTKTRPWLLGDIFHSSPIVVEPPIAPEACEFFTGQCLLSLFDTPADTSDAPVEAYRGYIEDTAGPCGGVACERRKKLMLVGANDGFLHAFDYGSVKSPDKREQITNRLDFSDGTGKEVWAFIPPDLLGSLKHSIGKHAYFVDGTPMVRDIWVDAPALNNGDGARAKGEFHTVAIVGERTGGQHFFALDVTKNATGSKPKPTFLWLWPQPCDQMAGLVGESWSNFAPRPPPIGPVLLDADTTHYPAPFEFKYRRYKKAAGAWEDKTANAQERWIVMLNGGYDRYYVRGRGVAMVDAYTGQTLWDAFFDPSAGDLRSKLDYPIPAGVAMVDIGSGEPGTQSSEFFDGRFDTATFGDMGGNLWTARFFEPGQISGGKVANWTIARAFQTEKADGAFQTDRRPITYIAAGTIQPDNGYFRSVFGTGDRNAILDTDGGVCSLDKLGPCIVMGCEVSTEYQLKNDDGGGMKIKTKWKGGKIEERKLEAKNCVDPTCSASCQSDCGAACDEDSCSPTSKGLNRDDCEATCELSCPSTCVTACNHTELRQKTEVKGCPGGTTEGATDLKREAKFVCDMAGTELDCELEKLVDSNALTDFRKYKSGAVSALPKYRFFGVHTFGGANARVFGDTATAQDFDTARLTETNLVDVGTLSSTSTPGADEFDEGWVLSYDTTDEKTASAATITTGGSNLDRGCVMWNSLTPSGSSGLCSSTGSQQARMIQADFISGLPTCASSFEGQRYQTRSVITPPVEPTRVLMVANGRISYGVVSAEPGSPPQATVTGVETDLAQSVYTLELSPQEHLCRHVEGRSEMCTP